MTRLNETFTRRMLLALCIGLLLMLGFVGGRSTSASTDNAQPGAAGYTPTKIEWLVVQARLEIRDDTLNYRDDDGMRVDAHAKDNQTIVIDVSYMPNTPRSRIIRQIDNSKRLVRNIARRYGWEWLVTNRRSNRHVRVTEKSEVSA